MPNEARRSALPIEPAISHERAAKQRVLLRALIAEDHLVYRQLLGSVLEQFGIQPTLVADGGEAVTEWRRGRFDVLLLDINMPRMSGLAATRIIRSEEKDRSSTPIIIVSSDFRPESISQCLEAGADLHLAKPVTATVLASALNSVLGDGAFAAG